MASADITKIMVMTWKMTWGMTCQADTAAADPPLFQEHQAVPVLAVAMADLPRPVHQAVPVLAVATADLPRPAHQADPALAVAMADLPRPDLRADPPLVVTVAGLPRPARRSPPAAHRPANHGSTTCTPPLLSLLLEVPDNP